MRKKIFTLAPVLTVAALLGAGITGGAGASAATAAPAVVTAHPTVVASAAGKGARTAQPDGKGPMRLVRQPACGGHVEAGALAAC